MFNPAHRVHSVLLFVCAVLFFGCATQQPATRGELERRAEAGDVVAQRTLGVAYDFGNRPYKQNHAEAARWYQLAAAQGDAIAQNNLGSLYEEGSGVPKNVVKAFDLYKASAEQGMPEAQNSLGRMYDLGIAVRADPVEGNKWYRRAAEQGDPQAMFNLAVNYGFGQGVPKDKLQAFMWLDLARFFTQRSPDMKTKWQVRKALDDLKVLMTPEEIKEGERLTREWYAQFQKKKS